ncbi:ATP-binding protein [Streptomyces sp. 5K101]|uniref:ATP-binding protein n=1 Tax=Streptomyces sp. 5K101 TaxID=3390037 RepID=UPI003975C0DF
MSLTLPGEPQSAAIARIAVTSTLRAHALGRYVPPAVQAASEIVAVTARLAPGADLYLSLRHRDDHLRLVVWDQHPRHADPAAVTLCAARRRRALWLLDAVVDDWGGRWGICKATPQPDRGSKTWVVLPR